MASGKEYKLAIRIAGSVDKTFTSSLTSAKTGLSGWAAGFGSANNTANKMIATAKKAGLIVAGAATAAGIAIAKVGKSAVEAGIENESAFAGVRKTVKGNEKFYQDLNDTLWDLSETLPATYKDLSFVAETAGQLGIESKNVSKFTEVMTKLGLVSNDMEAADAAETFARFANITKMNQDFDSQGVSNWERLGSTVLTLGNNFATTEGQISEMALAMAAQASMVGFSEDQILAYATAMSSVGMSANVGGNNLAKVLSQIQLAVETNSKDLGDWASVAHMSAEDFAEAFKTDAAGTMATWIKGLSEGEGSATALLDSLGIKELRTSRLLKAMTQDSDGLFEALAMAEEAWQSNTGLGSYSADKLGTIASKITETENSLNRVKDTVYQQLRPYLGDAFTWIQEKLGGLNESLGGSTGLGSFIDGVIEQFPTFKRKADQFLKPVGDIFNGAFGFIANNSQLIIAGLTGIAGALAFIKIGYGVTTGLQAIIGFINNLKAGNPASIIGLASMAIGALVAGISYLDQLNSESIANNIASHFGTITLSMSDLETVASNILASKSLDGVKDSLAAFKDLEGIEATIGGLSRNLNKANWKVNVGIKLSAEEQQQYVDDVNQYVANMRKYAVDHQYAVALNVHWMLDGNSDQQNKINGISSSMTEAMTSLGEELSGMVNKAFEEGLLNDPETMGAIAEKQAQLSEIQGYMTTGKSVAAYSRISGSTKGLESLSGDTFRNLEAEVSRQLEADMATYQQAYDDTVGAAYASLQYAEKYAPGTYTETDYQSAVDTAQLNLLSNQATEASNSANALTEAIANVYGDTLSNAQTTIDTIIKEGATKYENYSDFLANLQQNDYGKIEINKALGEDAGALDTLFNDMSGMLTSLEEIKGQYETAGLEVPEAVQTAIDNIKALGLENFYVEDIFTEEAFNAAKASVETGAQGICDGITNTVGSDANIAATEAAGQQHITALSNVLNTTVDATVTANVSVVGGSINTSSLQYMVMSAINAINVPSPVLHNAEGGFVTSKELSWVGENGPEAIIPLDGSRSAQMLYEQTGRLMGMNSRFANTDMSSATGGAQITYAPVLNFNGGTPSKNDIVEALTIGQDEFDSLMESYMRRRARVAF